MTATETVFDGAKAEAFGGHIMSILKDGLLSSMVDIGHRTGTDVYDCIWFPTFFVTEAVLEAAMPRLYQAVRPGGWLVLGRMAPPPDPLAQTTTALRIIRGGGAEFDAKRLVAALETAGCTAVRVLPRQGPAPLEYVLGQRPAA